jgi:hypothetical protein
MSSSSVEAVACPLGCYDRSTCGLYAASTDITSGIKMDFSTNASILEIIYDSLTLRVINTGLP